MTSSQEVQDAVGAAPEQSAAERLAQQGTALEQAEQAIVVAEKGGDVPGLIAAQQVANRLRESIGSLQVEARRETETDARKEARTLVKTLRTAYEDAVAKFEAEAAGLDEQLRNLTPAVAALFERWSALDWRRRELAVVARRFELPDPGPLTPLPGTPDVALAVFDVAVRSNIRPSPQPIYGHVADMTPEQKHRADVVALAEYVRAHRRRLLPETSALFAKVPAPDSGPASPEQRAKNAKLERQSSEAMRQKQRAEAEAAAWSAIRNHDTPEAQQVREEKRRQVTRSEAATRKGIVEEAKQGDQVQKAVRGKGSLRGMRE